MIEKINVKTDHRNQLIDISPDIKKIIMQKGLKSGTVHIFCPHTTAAVTINENCDPSVAEDIIDILNKIVPASNKYRHSEGNADAHVKASVIGSSRTIFIENGQIMFGSWQGIFLCEFDGPRRREIWLKLITD